MLFRSELASANPRPTRLPPFPWAMLATDHPTDTRREEATCNRGARHHLCPKRRPWWCRESQPWPAKLNRGRRLRKSARAGSHAASASRASSHDGEQGGTQCWRESCFLLFGVFVLLIPDILDHPACWGESRRLFRRLRLSWPMGSGASERASERWRNCCLCHSAHTLGGDGKGAWLDT